LLYKKRKENPNGNKKEIDDDDKFDGENEG
jgi:hypothetical protein